MHVCWRLFYICSGGFNLIAIWNAPQMAGTQLGQNHQLIQEVGWIITPRWNKTLVDPIQTSCGRMPTRSGMNEKKNHSSEVRHIKTSWLPDEWITFPRDYHILPGNYIAISHIWSTIYSWGWLPYIAIIPVTSEMVYDAFDGTAQPPAWFSTITPGSLPELSSRFSTLFFIMWRLTVLTHWESDHNSYIYIWFLWQFWDSQDLKHVLASCTPHVDQAPRRCQRFTSAAGIYPQFRTRLSNGHWIGEIRKIGTPKRVPESCESGSYMKRSSVNSWNSFYLLGGTTNLYLDITWYNMI